jgi:hypothetical protein
MYKKRAAIATAGNTKPTNGTRMDGKNEAAIKILKFLIMIQIENGNDKNLV